MLPEAGVKRSSPGGAVFISRTNLNGIMTYCNTALCAVSGYNESELLGAPRDSLCHPDVPATIVADGWQRLRSGKPWRGVFKNRCKNGDAYWVDASLTSWIENGEKTGYVSLQYPATEAQISAAEKLYRATDQVSEKKLAKLSFGDVSELQQRLVEKIIALEHYHDSNEEELQAGSDIIMRVNSMNGLPDPVVRQLIRPVARYSGDIILQARTPADVLHVLLADAVGHGLTAAMNILPLSQAFYAMSKKGFDISRIAEELNENIHKSMPADRFVAAVLISVDLRSRVIEVWNGGNPAPVLVNSDGDILHQWQSRNLPLGILGQQDFSGETEVFVCDEDCQLFLFSDGLPEAASPDGVPFGERLIDALQRSSVDRRFDELMSALGSHLCGEAAHDDVSVAMIKISLADALSTEFSCPVNFQPLTRTTDNWRVTVSLSAKELKYVEATPLLMQIIRTIYPVDEHHSILFLILSELFTNALEHGLLQLDSSIKDEFDGFNKYSRLREQRLHALDNAKIEFLVERAVYEEKYGIKIQVVDSGGGFDYPAFRVDAINQIGQKKHGRGIALLTDLTAKLEFAGAGNDVTAYYVCS